VASFVLPTRSSHTLLVRICSPAQTTRAPADPFLFSVLVSLPPLWFSAAFCCASCPRARYQGETPALLRILTRLVPRRAGLPWKRGHPGRDFPSPPGPPWWNRSVLLPGTRPRRFEAVFSLVPEDFHVSAPVFGVDVPLLPTANWTLAFLASFSFAGRPLPLLWLDASTAPFPRDPCQGSSRRFP